MKPVRLSALTVAACGSTAGATAKFVVAPLERVKILYTVYGRGFVSLMWSFRYQTNPNLRFSWTSAYHTMQSIVSTNGIRGNFSLFWDYHSRFSGLRDYQMRAVALF